jgi:hypothetical protein
MLIVTWLDHRVDPAVVLGLRIGDAPVIDNLAFLAFPTKLIDAWRARLHGLTHG